MSKSTIGGVIGAVIGFYVGGPTGAQVGFMIGAGIGASFDTIQGRKVGEMSSPRAQEGEPIPLVFGTARVTGRLMSCGEPSIVEEGGKGGPQVVNETAYLSYSILVCESSEPRNSLVASIIMVIQNNKIVYDVTPDSVISAADNAKWLENKRFYYGEESQGVDATEQMIHGVGNVPAYRGLCRMVVTDEDVTQHGGGIPAYEFVVSRCPVEPPNHILITGEVIETGGPMWAAARVSDPLTFTGLTQASGADIARGTPGFRNNRWVVTGDEDARISFDNRETWEPLPNDHEGLGYPRGDAQLAPGPAGWLMTNPSGPVSAYDVTAKASPIESGFTSYAFETDVRVHGEETSMCRYTGGYYYVDGGAQGELSRSLTLDNPHWDTVYNRGGELNNCFAAFWDVVADPGDSNIVYACGQWATGAGAAPIRAQVRKGTIVAGVATFPDLLIDTAIGDADAPLQLEYGGGKLLVLSRGEQYIWTSEDGFIASHATGIGSDRTTNIPKYAHQGVGRRILYSPDEDRFYLFSGRSTGSPETGDSCVTTEEGLAFSAPAELPIKNIYGAAISTAFEPTGGGVIIPDAPGYEIDPITGEVGGPENSVANACGMTLQEIFDHLDNLAGIPTANRDSDAVADIVVPGYAIDSFMTVAEAKEPLRQIYRVACPEYDDKIHYRPLGLATDFIVDPDDLILSDEPTEKSVRGQTVEFPRRLHVQYVDANAGYKPMKQTAERISPDVRVKGEMVSGANITLEADTAKQAADIGLKVAWTEREDSREFALPMDYFAQTIPAHTFVLEGRRYRITDLRLDGGAIYITSIYDRISAFQSNATGTVGPRPTPPPSQVRGPSVSAVMNAPVLRDEDDKAGIYWAACGPMRGWKGAQLQVRRAGGAWENGPTIDSPAVMGELTATLPAASRYVQDNTNVLRVTMYRTDAAMDSTDFAGLMTERNVWAIQYPDGTVEVGQFETAVEVAEREWELTGLMRGRQDTVAGEHLVGAKFILLTESVRFVAIRPDDVGKTLEFRAVSTGTDPDAAEVQAVTFTTIESLREWQPYNVEVTPDGLGGYCVDWIGRARLGSSRAPAHSQWFEGYRVTFTIGSTVHEVDTTAQAICVSASTMLEVFGIGYGAPVVTVRARSRVATNDDDFDSPPGSPGDPTSGSEPFVAAGTWPGGYVGVPYVLRNGDADIVITGGYWDASVYGAIAPGVGALGYVPLSGSFSIIGIPNTAGTFTASVEVEATSPVAGHYGSAIVSNSVTIASTPTYSTIDLRLRENSRDRLIATTPPWTTFELPSGSLYCYGFDTGDHWGEFTITGSTGPLVVGINVALGELSAVGQRPGIAVGFPNHAAVETTLGDGTYAMSYDCATGAWEIFKLGTGSLASGTMALPSGNLARFVCTTNRVSPVQVKGNFGNEAWVYAPTGGQTGVPIPTPVIPAAWDDRDTPYRIMRGGNSFAGANAMLRPRGPGHTLASPGKSSGKWRFGVFSNGQRGLAVAAYDSADGPLGAAGTANSIGYDGAWLRWCFGGVASSAAVVVPAETYPYVVFALDMANSEATLCYADFDGNVTPLYTITGVPAGTWFPAESNSTSGATLTYNPAGPPGFGDWL